VFNGPASAQANKHPIRKTLVVSTPLHHRRQSGGVLGSICKLFLLWCWFWFLVSGFWFLVSDSDGSGASGSISRRYSDVEPHVPFFCPLTTFVLCTCRSLSQPPSRARSAKVTSLRRQRSTRTCEQSIQALHGQPRNHRRRRNGLSKLPLFHRTNSIPPTRSVTVRAIHPIALSTPDHVTIGSARGTYKCDTNKL
jgi:hypothetical protein